MSTLHSTYRWSGADLADALIQGLGHFEANLAREQAVQGMDALDEVDLHPHLAAMLQRAGFGVVREVRYPAARAIRRKSEGRRCDLVLTPDDRPLHDPDAAATLFDDPEAVQLDDAFWLEVKTVAQFNETGANATWASELLSSVRNDVAKLAADPALHHKGLLIVLHAASDEVIEHDLGVWQDRCLEKGLPIGAPWRRRMPLLDRLGNTVCAVALYPVHNR
jgi:hypothetical protein